MALSPCSRPSPAVLHLGQPRCQVTGSRDPSLQSPACHCKSVSCDLSTVRSVSCHVPLSPNVRGACHLPCKWPGGLDEAEPSGVPFLPRHIACGGQAPLGLVGSGLQGLRGKDGAGTRLESSTDPAVLMGGGRTGGYSASQSEVAPATLSPA